MAVADAERAHVGVGGTHGLLGGEAPPAVTILGERPHRVELAD